MRVSAVLSFPWRWLAKAAGPNEEVVDRESSSSASNAIPFRKCVVVGSAGMHDNKREQLSDHLG